MQFCNFHPGWVFINIKRSGKNQQTKACGASYDDNHCESRTVWNMFMLYNPCINHVNKFSNNYKVKEKDIERNVVPFMPPVTRAVRPTGDRSFWLLPLYMGITLLLFKQNVIYDFMVFHQHFLRIYRPEWH